MDKSFTRRSFLTGMGVGVIGAASMGVLGCSPQSNAGGGETADTSAQSIQTSGNVDWLGSEPQIEDSEIVETIETEVLVIGAGSGGLFTACAAAEEGAKVLVVEKTETFGNVRNDLAAIGTKQMLEDGTTIDVEEIVSAMMTYASGDCNEELHRIWAKNSAEAVDWYGDRLAEHQITLWHEFATVRSEDKYRHFPVGHSPEWPDKETSGGLILSNYAISLGVDIRYQTPMVKLIKEGNSVVGAIAQNSDGGFIKIVASKGVVVSTGGYSANMEMLAALQPNTFEMVTTTNASPSYTGDGLKACLWAGAAMDETHSSMLQDRAAIPPDSKGGQHSGDGDLLWIGSQPWLKVNKLGKRFLDESCPYDFIIHAARHQPEHAWYSLWDSDWKEAVQQFDTHGCSRIFPFENGAPGQFGFETIEGMLQGLLEKGFLMQADSIEELADKLLIPRDALKETVEHYNEMCAKGIDEDFGKEPYRMRALTTPPFYGARQSGMILCTMDGIVINTEFQALDADGNPIEGLYVIGNDSGGYYANTYPSLATGHAVGRTVTFGRMLGKRLASS